MGLFSKTHRAHKAVPHQAAAFSEPLELQAGMVAEVFKNHKWVAGRVDNNYRETGYYFWPFEGGIGAGFELTDDHIIRQSDHANKQAIKYYQELIKQNEALINHDVEKSRIAEYQEKVNGLLATNPEAGADVTSKASSKRSETANHPWLEEYMQDNWGKPLEHDEQSEGYDHGLTSETEYEPTKPKSPSKSRGGG